MTLVWTLLIVVAVIALAVGLAYVPMKLLVTQIARNVVELIERQRERRQAPRPSPDRRKSGTPETPA